MPFGNAVYVEEDFAIAQAKLKSANNHNMVSSVTKRGRLRKHSVTIDST